MLANFFIVSGINWTSVFCKYIMLWLLKRVHYTMKNSQAGFTLKRVRDMTRQYSQMHRTDKYTQLSSIIWSLWPNSWVFVYELSGCGFESSCSHKIPNLKLLLCISSLNFLMMGFIVKKVVTSVSLFATEKYAITSIRCLEITLSLSEKSKKLNNKILSTCSILSFSSFKLLFSTSDTLNLWITFFAWHPKGIISSSSIYYCHFFVLFLSTEPQHFFMHN